ncbi:hypothetical protein ACP70R_023323 [Stipagrostis hirtigluma subsp. patula]
MGRTRGGSKRKKARTAGGAGGDHITALPLELRARIASLLHFRDVVQLSVLSKPWRDIHLHTPVVKIYLHDFLSFQHLYFDDEHSVPGILDEDAILGARVALGRRAQEGSGGSKVDALRLAYVADDARMRRHAGRIMALADAREIHIVAPYRGRAVRDAWPLDLPPAARHLAVDASDHLVPAMTGPGAAALRKLRLHRVVLGEWPRLPSLRFLSLDDVTFEAPFAPGAWCPLLEELVTFSCKIEQARVDIRLPLLKFLDLVEFDVRPRGHSDEAPFGEVTVDAPELVALDVDASRWSTVDYKSFTLRAPRLEHLYWHNQFAERVRIDVGKPCSVEAGWIEFMSIYTREIKHYRGQMMQMLAGLLPDVPPESVADITRPYRTRVKYTEVEEDGEVTTEEKITCDLRALMSRGI